MKKVGSSFKKLGGLFLGLVLLFLLFKMFSGSREGFKCAKSSSCNYQQDTNCTSEKGQNLTCKSNNTWG